MTLPLPHHVELYAHNGDPPSSNYVSPWLLGTALCSFNTHGFAYLLNHSLVLTRVFYLFTEEFQMTFSTQNTHFTTQQELDASLSSPTWQHILKTVIHRQVNTIIHENIPSLVISGLFFLLPMLIGFSYRWLCNNTNTKHMPFSASPLVEEVGYGPSYYPNRQGRPGSNWC